MTDEEKMAFLGQMLKGADIKQLIIDNHGTINFHQSAKAPTDNSMSVTPQQMATAIERTMQQGLWWSGTAWSVAYRIYCLHGYKGSQSQFERDVDSWTFTRTLAYACKLDAISKPLREDPLFGSVDDWRNRGVNSRKVKLGAALEEQLKSGGSE